MSLLSRFLPACAAVALYTAAAGQSGLLVSKSIPLVFGVADKIFAFSSPAEGPQSYSRIDSLFAGRPTIQNNSWLWSGGAEGGAGWRQSLILRSDVAASDTTQTHVARVARLFSDGKLLISDSLVLPLIDSGNSAARGAGLTALAVWHDTLILGFGRLGIAYARMELPETGNPLFADSTIAFSALPTGTDSMSNIAACVWNRLCRVDTLPVPGGGLDSVLALAVDSSNQDSIWLLAATQSGLRRGLLGSRNFTRLSLPGVPNSVPVQGLFSSPDHRLLWAFTGGGSLGDNFFSSNHGASFRIPDSIPGLQTQSSALSSDAAPPQVAFYGDTTIVNFNLRGRPGLVMFRGDSLLRSPAGSGPISDVLVEAEDGLDITQAEGSLTTVAVARSGGEAILAAGSTIKGIFYRRLDGAGTAFTNLNRLRAVQGSLAEVITFPTLFGSEFENGLPKPVHIGYSLKKDGNVTITILNYAMEKVRVLVKNRRRLGGGARSENPAEDLWDGTDAGGRYVSVGTYYILVESDQGERGFGRAICVRGHQ